MLGKPRFRPRAQKRADDGTLVVLALDPWDAWYAGPAGERFLMGAFMREEGARAWADQVHPGGVWEVLSPPKAHPQRRRLATSHG